MLVAVVQQWATQSNSAIIGHQCLACCRHITAQHGKQRAESSRLTFDQIDKTNKLPFLASTSSEDCCCCCCCFLPLQFPLFSDRVGGGGGWRPRKQRWFDWQPASRRKHSGQQTTVRPNDRPTDRPPPAPFPLLMAIFCCC